MPVWANCRPTEFAPGKRIILKLDSNVRRLGDMTGRTALVTGASSGIGAATVHRFLDAGARVHAVARRLEVLEALDPVAVADGRLVPHSVDVADGVAVQALLDEL